MTGVEEMSDLDVRVVQLDPMRVAAALGFGPNPEELAWRLLLAWAGDSGLLERPEEHRFFGFNNPSPSPGSPNYGYEQWITVGPEVASEGEVEVKEFSGGLYAVTRCQLETITETWQQLVTWSETSRFRRAHHQWLEESIDPPVDGNLGDSQAVLDLYLPIAE
jgi:DNA gyrase inhibitor GyrI